MTLDESLRALEKKWRLSSNATSNDRWDDGYQVACEDHADELATLLTTRQEVAPVAGLAVAVRMLLDSAPPHMTPRNAKEREAYKLLRKLMEKEPT